jgi:hypothetical protein
MASEIGTLRFVGLVSTFNLFLDRFDTRCQQPVQTEDGALTLAKGCAFIPDLCLATPSP